MTDSDSEAPLPDDAPESSAPLTFLPEFESPRRFVRGVAPPSVALELHDVTKRFDADHGVFGLELQIRPGDVLTVLGPPGCGKTTVLRLIAGLERPDSGEIRFEGLDLRSVPPERRGFGVVFQDRALFPHLDVRENIAYGLRARRLSVGLIYGRVQEALERVGLPGIGAREIRDLSAVERQGVALARALVIRPSLLLLDEPLSATDPSEKAEARSHLRSLLCGSGITAILTSCDRDEAFELSDCIAVMQDGWIRQSGIPEELYQQPAELFVATFLGSANVLRGEVRMGPGDRGMELHLPSKSRWRVRLDSTRKVEVGQELLAVVRPEDLAFAPGAARGTLTGEVIEKRFRGPNTSYRIRLDDGTIVEVDSAPGGPEIEDKVHLALRPAADIHLFPPPPRSDEDKR